MLEIDETGGWGSRFEAYKIEYSFWFIVSESHKYGFSISFKFLYVTSSSSPNLLPITPSAHSNNSSTPRRFS